MNARRRHETYAFTLIELMIAVAIISVLALLATLGVRRYLTTARTAEAKGVVGAIARGAAAAYERDSARAEIVPPGADGGYAAHGLCASVGSEAAGHGPVPATLAQVAGKKYQPRTADGVDFETGTARGGWRCLRFTLTEPIHYQYRYNARLGYLAPAGAPPLGSSSFEAAAQGDVDADGTPSAFVRGGTIDPVSRQLAVATQVYSYEELE